MARESHCVRNLLLSASARLRSGPPSRRPALADRNYLLAQAPAKLWKQTEAAAGSRDAMPHGHSCDTPGDWVANDPRQNQPLLSIFEMALCSLSFNCTVIWRKGSPGVSTVTLIYTGGAPGCNSEVSGSKE